LVTFPKIEYVLQSDIKKINAHHTVVKSKVLHSLHDWILQEIRQRNMDDVELQSDAGPDVMVLLQKYIIA